MKIKADDVEYDFPDKLELGELRLLKRHFDLARPDEFDIRNIDHMAGLLFIALRRSNPVLPVDAVIAKVDATQRIEFPDAEEGTEEERPTKAGDPGKGKAGK